MLPLQLQYTSSPLFTVTVQCSLLAFRVLWFSPIPLPPPPSPAPAPAIPPSTRLRVLLSHWLLFTVFTSLQALFPTIRPKPYNRRHILQQTNVKKIAKTRAETVWIELSDNSMAGDIYRATEVVCWPGRMTTWELRLANVWIEPCLSSGVFMAWWQKTGCTH